MNTTHAPVATSAFRASAIRLKRSSQSPCDLCRNNLAVGYHGLSSRWAIHDRHSRIGERASQHVCAQSAGEVRKCRIGRDHQVEQTDQAGCIDEVCLARPRQLDNRKPPTEGANLIKPVIDLQAD